jgi:hypothetical protein
MKMKQIAAFLLALTAVSCTCGDSHTATGDLCMTASDAGCSYYPIPYCETSDNCTLTGGTVVTDAGGCPSGPVQPKCQ